MDSAFNSPFIVPVAGCIMILGLGASGIYSQIRTRELRSQERLAMMHRGMPLEEIERAMGSMDMEEKKVRDPLRSLGNTRRSATVLLSCGVGLVIFGLLLWLIVGVRETLVVSAVGVINLAIGVGFLLDYNMQQRELARFGMEVDSEAALLENPRNV